jgi:hypothetical protein
MFIESDLTMNDQNQVIMAHPPDTTSDLTFTEWYETCKTSKKGLKLDFKTQNVIETCIKTLSQSLTNPIILNADILQANLHTSKPLINADYFLKSTKTHQTSILSLGWTTVNSSTLNYSWLNVFEMYNLIKKYILTQVTLPVRANWALKSLYRLAWLCKHTNSTLTIWSHDTDALTSNESLLLFRKYFDSSIVFYDLPSTMRGYLNGKLEEYNEVLSRSDDELVGYYLKFNNFREDLWLANGQVFLNEFGGLMSGHGAMLKTRRQYKADEISSVIYELFGKFEIFKNEQLEKPQLQQQEVILDKNLIDETNSVSSNNDCIKISLRTSEGSEVDDGRIVILLFLNGLVKIDVDGKVIQGNLYSTSNFFEFLITDVGESNNIHIDLVNYDSNMNKYSLQYLVGARYRPYQKFFIKIQLLSSIYSVGIDCLKLSDEIADPQDNHGNANY